MIRAQTLVAFLLATTAAAIGFGQDETRNVEKAQQLLRELAELKLFVPDNEAWVRTIKDLVELGDAATLPVCEVMKSTDESTMLRLCGFMLRALDDPRAVPTLIECLPKTLGSGSSDLGLHVGDKELLEFMQQHDVSDVDQEGSFSLGLPRRELIHALEKLTQHQFDDSSIVSINLSGGPRHRYLQRKAYYDFAVQFKTWWYENYRKAGADMGFVDVELPEFDLKEPEIENVLEKTSAICSGHFLGAILGPPGRERNQVCLMDLDRGIRSELPARFEGDPKDLDRVEAFARENHFDLIGMKIQLPGYDEPQYVIKAIGMEIWQIEHRSIMEFGGELDPSELDLSQPGQDYLAYFDSALKQYDVDRKTTFVYRTSEGTFGAVEVMSVITKLMTEKDFGRPSDSVKDNEGFRYGVKIGTVFMH